MVSELKVGDKIPAFQAKDQKGFNVNQLNLIGTTVVIYFYPKDDTPGCTTEACSFRDKMRSLDALATIIIGVSPDSIESHKKFIKKNQLEFSLLSDEQKEMCKQFGVLDGDKVIRSTFLIDADGVIRWIEKPVNVEGHIDRIIEAVKEYCPSSVIKFDEFNANYAEFLQGGLNLQEAEKKIKENIKKKFQLPDPDHTEKKKKK